MKVLKIMTFSILSFLCFSLSVNATDLEAIADEVVPNDKIEFNSIKPTSGMELDFYTNLHMMNLSEPYGETIQIGIRNCNEAYSECTLMINEIDINNYYQTIDSYTRNIAISFKETNPIIKEKIDSFIEKLHEIQGSNEWGYNNYFFDINDMNLINYYKNSETKNLDNSAINKVITYSEELRNMFNGVNLTYAIDFRAGAAYLPFSTHAFGGLLFKYDNIVYGFADPIGFKLKEIIYVPSDTELTDEALIAAAKRRIEEYLPNSNLEISIGSDFSTFQNEYGEVKDFNEVLDATKTTTKTYNINFGNFSVPFAIVADSSKMTSPKFSTKDINTNVEITSISSSIPLDTIVNVNQLDKNSAEYKKIAEVLGVEKMKSFDLTLFSKTKNSNITQLENGKFKVSIPVPSEFEGKELIVYYVNANNEKEVHQVTIKDKMATFETDHFSTYTLAVKAEENPQTLDNIIIYIIIGVISLGLLTSLICIQRKKIK